MKTVQLTTDEIRFLLYAIEEAEPLHDNETVIATGLSQKLAAALGP